jgi:serine/threonine-protein kinase
MLFRKKFNNYLIFNRFFFFVEINNQELLKIIYQIASGVEMLHRNRVIHRDIKPRNILIFKGGIVKIADFGLTKRIPEESLRHSTTLSIIGTPFYYLFYHSFLNQIFYFYC